MLDNIIAEMFIYFKVLMLSLELIRPGFVDMLASPALLV